MTKHYSAQTQDRQNAYDPTGRYNAQSWSPFPPSRNARRNKYGPKIASKGKVIASGTTFSGYPNWLV